MDYGAKIDEIYTAPDHVIRRRILDVATGLVENEDGSHTTLMNESNEEDFITRVCSYYDGPAEIRRALICIAGSDRLLLTVIHPQIDGNWILSIIRSLRRSVERACYVIDFIIRTYGYPPWEIYKSIVFNHHHIQESELRRILKSIRDRYNLDIPSLLLLPEADVERLRHIINVLYHEDV